MEAKVSLYLCLNNNFKNFINSYSSMAIAVKMAKMYLRGQTQKNVFAEIVDVDTEKILKTIKQSENKNRWVIGDLPVGLKGKIYGLPFKVIIQYDIEGKVEAEIYEDGKKGNKIVSISGDKKNTAKESLKLYTEVIAQAKLSEDDKSKYFKTPTQDQYSKMIFKDCEKIVKQLSEEVRDFNEGKNTKITKGRKIDINKKRPKGERPKKKTDREKVKDESKGKGDEDKNQSRKNLPYEVEDKNGNSIFVKKANMKEVYKINPNQLQKIAGMSALPPSPFKTLSEVKVKNKEAGYYFFSPQTLKFFKTKFHSVLIYGRFFIDSSTFVGSSGHGITRFHIRYATNDGQIKTIQHEFNDKHSAKKYLYENCNSGQIYKSVNFGSIGKLPHGAGRDFDEIKDLKTMKAVRNILYKIEIKNGMDHPVMKDENLKELIASGLYKFGIHKGY